MNLSQVFKGLQHTAASVGALLLAAVALPSEPRSDQVAEVAARLQRLSASLARGGQRNPFLVEIGLAQLKVKDLNGAKNTLEPLAAGTPRVDYYDFLKGLLILQVQLGESKDALAGLAQWHLPPWENCEVLLAMARAYSVAGNQAGARDACLAAIQTAKSCADPQRRGYLLFQVGRTQIELRDGAGAQRTVEELGELLNHGAFDDQDRTKLLAGTAFIYAKTGRPELAKKLFHEAKEAGCPESLGRVAASHFIATLQAEAGDFDAATRTGESIPASSGERCLAFSDIARLQLSEGDIAGAERSIMAIDRSCDCRNTALIAVAKVYADKDDAKNARQIAGQITSDTRRAQAMLEIAAILAAKGRKVAAREIANGLTYPRDPWERLAGRRPSFAFSFQKPDTWGLPYEPYPLSTMAGRCLAKEIIGDLTCAAMRCRVLLDGTFEAPEPKVTESWDVRKVAGAQAAAGDIQGALSWSAKLPEHDGLLALLGVADGVAAMATAKRL